jgi:hypothetical protein
MDKQEKGLQKKKTEIDHLKELIRRSGLPLELEIAGFLSRKKQWTVSTKPSYLDKDVHAGRSIDILADYAIWEDIQPDTCFHHVELLIECKKIPGNAWVFVKPSFTVPQPPYTFRNIFHVIDSGSVDAYPLPPHNLHQDRNCPIAI